jgi:hypothetical protein
VSRAEQNQATVADHTFAPARTHYAHRTSLESLQPQRNGRSSAHQTAMGRISGPVKPNLLSITYEFAFRVMEGVGSSPIKSHTSLLKCG